MSLENKFKTSFFSSLRFKLTLVYSIILFLFSSSLVLGINIYLNDYLQETPPQKVSGIQQHHMNPFWEFDQAQREQIQEIRLQDLRRIQTLSVISLIPLSLGSFAVGYFISGEFLKPLNKLNTQINLLNDSELGTTVKVTSDDEIGELTSNFNKMSKRLRKSFDLQTQFVQDASHELKTPLTIIQANLDYALDDPKISREEMKESIEDAIVGIKRLNTLTENLLNLTAPQNISKEKTNLKELIQTQVNSLQKLANKENVGVKFKKSKAISREVDPELFGRAIFNLIENAIKYASKGVKSEVEIALLESNESKDTIIKVTDNGPGISGEAKDKIFDRFYRADTSRSKESRTGGFGLGLAITKQIIEYHGGEIKLTSLNNPTMFEVII